MRYTIDKIKEQINEQIDKVDFISLKEDVSIRLQLSEDKEDVLVTHIGIVNEVVTITYQNSDNADCKAQEKRAVNRVILSIADEKYDKDYLKNEIEMYIQDFGSGYLARELKAEAKDDFDLIIPFDEGEIYCYFDEKRELVVGDEDCVLSADLEDLCYKWITDKYEEQILIEQKRDEEADKEYREQLDDIMDYNRFVA